ncbi:MAG: glycosyltransferase family 39 protein [Deltaproteobacteria bacterium]|nr:glycosyltransferase family 39 protein [Deltaproteobacteria bacterium]
MSAFSDVPPDASARPPEGASVRACVAWTAVLALAGIALPQVLCAAVPLSAPAGLDPALWGFAALEMQAGTAPMVPPIYPLLASLLQGSGDIVTGAARASALAAACTGPLVFAVARALGARPWGAGLAGLLALSLPRIGIPAVSVSPDALTVDLFAASVLVAVRFGERPTWLRLAVLGAIAALAPLIREHGLLLSLGLAVVVVAAPGTWGVRALRTGGVLAAVGVGPVLVGMEPTLPWAVPWVHRLVQPGVDLLHRDRPTYLGDLPEQFRLAGMSERQRDLLLDLHTRRDRPQIVAFHCLWALVQAPVYWALVLGALVAAVRLARPRALSAWVGLVPVLPALGIWSAPRHVAVAAPVALAVLAAWVAPHAGGARSRRVRILAGAGLVSLVASTWTTWPDRARDLGNEADHLSKLARFGRSLCALARPGDVGIGVAEAFLFCPLPLHVPGERYGAAEWHAWWVVYSDLPEASVDRLSGPRPLSLVPPEPPWAVLELPIAGVPFTTYRLVPWMRDRPCAESRPDPGFRPRYSNPTTVPMTPPCSMEFPGRDPNR